MFAGPSGRFAEMTSSMACTECPENYVSPSGSTSVHDCTPIIQGRCLGNTDTTTDVACPVGAIPIEAASTTESSNVETCCETCGKSPHEKNSTDACRVALAFAKNVVPMTPGFACRCW